MKTKRLLIISLSAAAAVAVILFAFLVVPTLTPKSASFQLPKREPTHDLSDNYVNKIESVELTADNVGSVIATLKRPDAYSRDIAVVSFWDGGTASLNFSVSEMDGMVSIRNSAIQKTVIIRDGLVFMRYDGESKWLTLSEEERAADEYQMIPTYEDIISLDHTAIQNVELSADESGDPIIVVTVHAGTLGYTTIYSVSVRYGLLVSAMVFDGETLVRTVTAGACELSSPDPSVFDVTA